jgi:transcriptional regulator with XRE-family HTH domain
MDDYTSDMNFGAWLIDQRKKTGLTVEQAAEKSGLTTHRLRSLEMGYAERSINRSESEQLCRTYQLPLEEFIERAIYSN